MISIFLDCAACVYATFVPFYSHRLYFTGYDETKKVHELWRFVCIEIQSKKKGCFS